MTAIDRAAPYLDREPRTQAQALADRDAIFWNFFLHPRTGQDFIEQGAGFTLAEAIEDIRDCPLTYRFSHCRWERGLAEVDLTDLVLDVEEEERREKEAEARYIRGWGERVARTG